MVIVILGTLAVVAIPKFLDLRADAANAALSGVVASLTSASSINYAARNANPAKGSPVANCLDVANLLQGGLPDGYGIWRYSIAPGATQACIVQFSNSSIWIYQNFSALGIL